MTLMLLAMLKLLWYARSEQARITHFPDVLRDSGEWILLLVLLPAIGSTPTDVGIQNMSDRSDIDD
jgi:hypothetical protein